MRVSMKFVALSGVLLTAPVLASSQAAGRDGMPGVPMSGRMARGDGSGAGVTHILNARRQLELTARQVAQLDSIERALHVDREDVRTQMQARGRQTADSLQGHASAAAQRILTEAQRQKLREMEAERRGYARGQRGARMGQGPNARFAPRHGAAPRGRMMPREGRITP